MSTLRALYYQDQSGTPEYPSSDDVARFAEFASAYGDYRIARAAMTLAVELADRDADDTLTAETGRALRQVPKLAMPMRDEQPRTAQDDAPATTSEVTGNGDADLAAAIRASSTLRFPAVRPDRVPIYEQASDQLGDTAVMPAPAGATTSPKCEHGYSTFTRNGAVHHIGTGGLCIGPRAGIDHTGHDHPATDGAVARCDTLQTGTAELGRGGPPRYLAGDER